MFDTVSLDQLATFEMGQSPDSNFVVESDEGTPFLQGCAEFGAITPNSVVSCIRPKKICKPGDILISVRAPVGDLNKADREYCIGRGLAAIRFKNGIDTNFGWHLLNYWATSLRVVAQGSTFEAIGKQELANLQIADIPLPEQPRIAEILDTIDEAIQKTEALISKLKAMKQGLLHDLLTRGLDRNGKLRDPKAHPEQFKDSPLGRIPKEWEVVTIEAIGADKLHAIVDGPFGSNLKSIHYRKKGIPVIQSGFVTTGEFIAHEYVYVDNALFQAQRRSAVVPGDIVMAKIGAQCGTCAILPEGHPVGILAGNSLKISTNPNYCRTLFLLRVLYRYYQIGLMDKVITETAQPAISLKNLRAMMISLPSSVEQDSIIDVLDSQDALICTEEQYRDKLKLQKKGLMHDLLTGKVRVQI